ncbi:hypothetical protein [Spirosoma aerolatum]|uniref:hypothetical protein n=1 Tax=Spirosoma aerolatum TaxID=1211326 RepID=UPI0009ACDF0C|nr:hypothetical protein [Spirosoma aerolatum]
MMLLLEIVATMLRFQSIRNHFIHYFFTVFVLWIGAYFYAPILSPQWLIILIALLVTVGIPAEVIGWVGFNHINTVTETLAWLLLAVYAFVSLIRLFELPVAISLRHDGGLYYHVGFFIWSVFKAGRACFLNYFIETSLDLYYFADTLVVIVGAIAYSFFAIGFMFRKR